MSQEGGFWDGTHLPDIETITGNAGGAVGPDAAFDIDVTGLANSGIYTTGVPGTNTFNIAMYSPFFGAFEFSDDGAAKTVHTLLTLTNRENAADMDGTGTRILFNQWYYDAVTPAVASAGSISVEALTDWTSVAGSRDAKMSLGTVLDGTMRTRLELGTVNHDVLAVNNYSFAAATKGVLAIASNRSFGATVDGSRLDFIAANGTFGSHDYGTIIFENNSTVNDGGSAICKMVIGGTATASENGKFLEASATTGGRVTALTWFTGNPSTASLSIDINGITTFHAIDAVNEGGEVKFEGAGAYSDWNADIYQNSFRYQTSNASDADVLYSNLGAGMMTLEVSAHGTVKTAENFLILTNRGNAVDMDGTGTNILWQQYAYDAVTPAVYASGSVGIYTEQDWTVAAAASRDSYMGFRVSENGTLYERMTLSSHGGLNIWLPAGGQSLIAQTGVDGTWSEISARSGVGGSVQSLHQALEAGAASVVIFGSRTNHPVNFYVNATQKMSLSTNGVCTLGIGTVDATAVTVHTIFNGTAPAAAVTDGIQLYAQDSGDATSTLALYTEQAVQAGAPTPSHKLKIRVNGVEYWISLDAV